MEDRELAQHTVDKLTEQFEETNYDLATVLEDQMLMREDISL